MVDQEKRRHRRLQIQLPLEVYPEDSGRQAACRTITRNISSGGVYFEVDREPMQEGTEIHLALTVPPGPHFPYEGRVQTIASVVRVEPVDGASKGRPDRFGIGVRLDRWELAF